MKDKFYTTLIERLNGEKARQDSEAADRCPRCGIRGLRTPISENPRSKCTFAYVVDSEAGKDVVYAPLLRICDECADQENALEKMRVQQMQPWEWACVQPRVPAGDFKAMPGATAWAEIERDQLPILLDVFARYLGDEDAKDPAVCAAYDFEARGKCKGVRHTNMRLASVDYEVADGVLRMGFRLKDGAIQYFACVEGKTGPTRWLTE